MQLFYHPHITETSKEIFFDKEESRHIIKVLRKKEGDTLHLTNGKGSFFNAILISTNPKQCIANIEFSKKQKPLNYKLHLAVAPTKLNDRYEWFLEKATEIGITEITPIICDHSERKVIKLDRFEKKIQSAMKQSLKAYLPIIHPAISFKEFITSQENIDSKKYIAHCEETEKKSLKSSIKANETITILIGPEGDFSPSEVANAKLHQFIPVSLGKSRLRTETAAIVACHSVAFVNEV
ncbi:MAG: 16S rRNA (uracil1498-N3)-methyltransferase [Flavobacteriaceae bacterium]|jgi:16S rRNA (uracil1498-N3)-methyltransferase|uniref:16S rRNA (uracil(1498)-N(3))-methyltransferase n=1 Tax=Candidatus Marifrigoribacter sp. Uisw_064 TaxID=3230970 RepID=UPI003AE7B2B7